MVSLGRSLGNANGTSPAHPFRGCGIGDEGSWFLVVTQEGATRRENIRLSAAQLWAAKGYHATGVEELSRVVGLRRGALYHHIASKEDLLHEIVLGAIERLLANSRLVVGLDPVTRIRSLSRILMEDIAEYQSEWTVFFREIEWLTGSRRLEIFRLRASYEALWDTVLADGIRAHVFKSVHPVATKGILGMHNYAYLWLRPDGDLSPKELADVFCDLLLNGLVETD